MIGPHILPLREIRLPWTCSQTGDCCRAVGTVLMTSEERVEIETFIGPERATTLFWSPAERTPFVRLRAHPCPLLGTDNRCSVYKVRPYNCRRWGCFRADVKKEALEVDHSFLGCANARDRFYQDRGVRRQMHHMQREAQRWARKHGWKDNVNQSKLLKEK